MQTPDESPTQKQAARRRLVRGVFAAPALMTVCTGSAWATGSSLRCLNQHVTDGTNITPKVGDLDTWARVQLHQADTGLYYVSGSQVASVYTTSGSVYPATGEWLQIDATSGAPVGSPGTTMPSGANLTYSPAKYAVVRFDGAGNVTGIGTAGSGANVGASCWSSFKALV